MDASQEKSCAACRGEIPRLTAAEIARHAGELHADWQVVNGRQIEKTYLFADFKAALAFTNLVGDLAEAEGHHPEIHLAWGRVRLVIWTHAVNGLTGTDFALASKADRLGASA
jgi:4a-hydroxytetrahydrobiopterin dehydratase